MKRLLVVLALLVASLLAGCGPGLVYTGAERERRYRNIVAIDARQINDDWDNFWIMDKPSRMTYWHLREAD